MKSFLAGCLLAMLIAGTCFSSDWPRFRGPNGSGISEDTVPTEWGDDTNLKWKVELPGPGTSSPIVVGDRVVVTCYTGYGVGDGNPGNIEDLKRHLLCIDKQTGDVLWQQTVDVVLPEDPYAGPGIPEHGYATHTPVSDGERVYAFFGKSGVHAYDMEGNHLWDADVGHESAPQRWGSGASPMLAGNLLVVNASDENEALFGINTENGSVEWKTQAAGLDNTWGTPILVESKDGSELVIGVPNEVWSLNPESGKLRWFATVGSGGGFGGSMFCSGLVTDGKVVYGIAGRGGGAMAVRIGGDDDVTDSNIVWRESASVRISSPVLYEGRLYSITSGKAMCLDAESGETVYQERLPRSSSPRSPQAGGPRGFGGGRGGFGGAFGAGGGMDYTSPIIAGGKLIFISGSGDGYVIAPGPEFNLIAQNRFESDTSRFNATPAVSDGQLFIRSNAALYCVGE